MLRWSHCPVIHFKTAYQTPTIGVVMQAIMKRIRTIDGHDPAEYKPGEPD
jgi:hypothetical protein